MKSDECPECGRVHNPLLDGPSHVDWQGDPLATLLLYIAIGCFGIGFVSGFALGVMV